MNVSVTSPSDWEQVLILACVLRPVLDLAVRRWARGWKQQITPLFVLGFHTGPFETSSGCITAMLEWLLPAYLVRFVIQLLQMTAALLSAAAGSLKHAYVLVWCSCVMIIRQGSGIVKWDVSPVSFNVHCGFPFQPCLCHGVRDYQAPNTF